ncbi:hypothetical protein, partial [Serratia marcescens]|uniref:hypothetical protein n=1 Tax=Serratia marcescens TaxID=615 RepID=UPI0013DD7BD8
WWTWRRLGPARRRLGPWRRLARRRLWLAPSRLVRRWLGRRLSPLLDQPLGRARLPPLVLIEHDSR